MNCKFCGIAVPDGMEFCPNCGKTTIEPVPEPIPEPDPLTKKEFYHLPENSRIRRNINVCSIVGYVVAGICLAGYILFGNIPAGVVSAVLFVSVSLLIQLNQSFAASIILIVLGVANAAVSALVGAVVLGSFTGGLTVAIGIDAVIWTWKFRKAWKGYQVSVKSHET